MILLPPLKPKQKSSGSFAYRSEKSAGSLSKLWEGQELSVFTVGFIVIGFKTCQLISYSLLLVCCSDFPRPHCTGGTGISEQIAELKRGAEIIVCTPGRMIDMLAANSGKVSANVSSW